MDHKICRLLDIYFPADITDIIFDYHKINNTIEIVKIEDSDAIGDYFFNIAYNGNIFAFDPEYIDDKFENFVNDLSKNKTNMVEYDDYDGFSGFSYDAKTNIFKQYIISSGYRKKASKYEVKLSEGERLLFAKKLSEMIAIKND